MSTAQHQGGTMSGIHCRWMSIPEIEVGDFGHVDHQNYIRWMFDMAEQHFSAIGFDREFFKELTQCFVVRRQRVEHVSPCLLDDKVFLVTWISELGNKALKRQHRIFKLDKSQNLRPVLRAQALSIFVDHSVAPIPIPSSISDVVDVVSDREIDDIVRTAKLSVVS